MTSTNDSAPALSSVVPLDAASDVALCGRKAATLSELKRAGFAVPDGVVWPVGASSASDAVRAALASLDGDAWAVRSSGTDEDGDTSSLAGRYASILGPRSADEVAVAIERVRASARGEGDAADVEAIPVLVQRLVTATASGVAFSRNPVTGDDEVVIEAVRGLGDALVSGERDAERWTVRNGRASSAASASVLDAELARRIADLARRVERERGAPQDVEWALEEDELFLLQARPITQLPRRPELDLPPGRWMKDSVHWSGPMTPAGASILLPILERSFATVFAEFGIPMETLRFRAFGGEVYTQEISPGGEHDPSAPPPAWLLGVLMRVLPPMRRLARAAEAAERDLDANPRAWETTWREACERRIDDALAVELRALTDEALAAHVRHLADDVLAPGMLVHFRLMIPDMVALHDLARCCEEALGWNVAQTLELVTGLTGRASDARVRSERWSARSTEFDPGAPTLGEQDALVGRLDEDPRRAASEADATRDAALERARAALRAEDRERFERLLRVAQRVHPMREDNVALTQSLPCGLLRRALLEIGRRLTEAGTLDAHDDSVFLELDELCRALDRPPPREAIVDLVRRRRAERTWVRAHPGPAFHGPPPVPPPSPRAFPRAMRRLFEALVWELELEDTPPAPASSDADTLHGVGASPGRHTGRVRIVRDARDLEQLEPGDVLICRSAHSSLAAAFTRIGALVTDHGGMLSHPAILAREHGIPAVLATGRATAILRDGQRVTVDGTTGTVGTVPR